MQAARLVLGLAALGAATGVYAGPGHEHGHDHGHSHGEERRQGEVHVHGLSTLNLVLEGRELAVELSGPAANFIGFEHRPRTDEQRALLEQALAMLADPTTLIELPAAAGCALREADVVAPVYDDGHGHDHGHDHGHGHDHDDHGTHSDLAATWYFECATPARLTSLPVQVFRQFPLTEEIQANLVTPEGQTRQVLSAERRILRLPR